MKNYDPNFRFGMHKVKITLQQWDYVGHVIIETRGNCQGFNVIGCADFEILDIDLAESDCDLQLFEDEYEVFTVKLKNENGDTLEIQEDSRGMNNMIVSVEILEFVEE